MVMKEKKEMWEKVLRAELGEFTSRVGRILSDLVEDDEWLAFRVLADELCVEYFEDMRDRIVP